MIQKKSLIRVICLLLIVFMSGNIVYASSNGKIYEVRDKDFSSNKELKNAKEYMDKGPNKRDFDSGLSYRVSDVTNPDGSRTITNMEKNHNGVYTVGEYTIYPPGDKKDRDKSGNDDKGSSQPSKPAPPPRPDNEIIIESKDNDTVVWIEREWEFDEPANEWKKVDYKYQVDLITSANIYDADGKQKNKVTVKAGYGIKVDGSSRFEMKQIAGTKKDSIAGFTQTLPTKGSVTTEFAVKKNIAQDKTLNLESKGNGSFVTAKNSGSKTGAKVVYTDIAQKDGSYNVVVKLYEAKLSGQVLGEHLMSQSNTLSFKIKGSMYEDSYVKPTDSTKNKNNTGFEPITFDNGFN